MIRNLHIYPSPFMFETRIMKETNSLLKLKLVDEIIITSLWKKGLKENEAIDTNRKVIRYKLLTRFFGKYAKVFNYIEFIIRVFFTHRSINLQYVNCHSLLVLPIGVLLKRFGRTKVLIYDPHELETERVGLVGNGQKLTKWLERRLIYYADKTIVVCSPIAEWYKNEYRIENVYVIKNMPIRNSLSRMNSTILKDKFQIPLNHVLYIYQGVLVNDRGIDTLLNIFSKLPSNKHIVFMGYGSSEKSIQVYSSLYNNIHFQPAVDSNLIIDYTSSADIGIFFISGDVCLSYQYCLPNKFGEYLMAGLPVLVSSSLSYMTEIIVNEKLGWALDARNDNALINFVHRIDKEHVLEARQNVLGFSEKIGWEFEEIEYLKIYQKI